MLRALEDQALLSGARNPARVRHSRNTVLPVGRNTKLLRRMTALGLAGRWV